MPPSNQDIPQKIQELQSTLSQVRFWRTLTVIAVILIVVTCVGLMYTSVTQLTTKGPSQEAFMKEFMTGVNEDIVPDIQRIASMAAADVAPLVQDELNQLNGRAPEFADAIRRELYQLSINVSSRGEKALDQTIGAIAKKRQGWIEQNFENVNAEKAQTMAENLTTIAHERVEHVTDNFFADHVAALNKITENLHQIQQAELANVRHEVPNWEMALLFFDIVRDELRGIETLNRPTDQIDAQVAADKGGEEIEASEDQ